MIVHVILALVGLFVVGYFGKRAYDARQARIPMDKIDLFFAAVGVAMFIVAALNAFNAA